MKKIGFIGLGNMGGRLCDAIIRGGFDVTVYDLREEVRASYADRATVADSSDELLAACDTLCLSLPSSREIEPLVKGWIEKGVAGKAIVDFSTSHPMSTKALYAEVKAAGGTLADVPVVGTPAAAEKGTLAVPFGGDKELFEEIRPLVSCFGDKYEYMGPSGCGDLTKLSINFLGLSYVGLYAQLFPLTEKMGIDNQVLQKLIGNSGTNCGVFQFYSGKMINRTYDMAFSLENAHKDLSYVKELYESYQVPAFMLDGLLDMLRAGIRDGDGPRDYSASIDTMTRYLEKKP